MKFCPANEARFRYPNVRVKLVGGILSDPGDIELGIGTERGHVGVQPRYQVGGQKVGNYRISLGGQILNGRGRQAWYRGATAAGG